MLQIISSVALIFLSLGLGYLYRKRRLAAVDQDKPKVLALLATLRDRLQFVAFFVFIPCAALFSLWGMQRPSHHLLILPLFGLLAWTLGGGISLILAKIFALNRQATGSLFCCATFSNIGAVGTLCCVVFLGEASIAYVALYRFCEEMFYYGLAIPWATRYSSIQGSVKIQGFKISRLIFGILLALAIGLTLNVLGIPRPQIFGYLSAFLSITACSMALFAIGLGLTISKLSSYPLPCACIFAIKFLCIPATLITLAILVGLGQLDSGLPLKTVAILSTMPVAMNALIPPALLKLDLDLANACFIFSTLALAIVLPFMAIFVLPSLG